MFAVHLTIEEINMIIERLSNLSYAQVYQTINKLALATKQEETPPEGPQP